MTASKNQVTAEEEETVEKGVKLGTGSPLNFIDFVVEKTEVGKTRRKIYSFCMVAQASATETLQCNGEK